LEPFYILDLIQDDQSENLTNSRDGAQQVKRVVIMLPSGFFDAPLKFFEDFIQSVNRGKVNLDAFSDRRIFESFGDAFPIVPSGNLFLESRQIVLGIGVLDTGDQLRAPSRQIHAALNKSRVARISAG
jgi:hypothetical protein